MTDPDARSPPVASVVVPARDEAAFLPATLASLDALETAVPYEVLVVDGGSDDATPAIAREAGAADPRRRPEHRPRAPPGAQRARGDWLAFVDADTTVRPGYLDATLSFVRGRGLAAASSRCRVTGTRRGKPMEWVVNRVFPRLSRPVLPGFNFVVAREVYFAAGGFPDVPNEDTALSRRLGREWDTAYCPEVLVETSGRRFARAGMTGALVHYLRLDWRRLRADR